MDILESAYRGTKTEIILTSNYTQDILYADDDEVVSVLNEKTPAASRVSRPPVTPTRRGRMRERAFFFVQNQSRCAFGWMLHQFCLHHHRLRSYFEVDDTYPVDLYA